MNRRTRLRNQKDEDCKQAVIFARVSSIRQEQGVSIEAQLESVYNYCKDKEYTVIKEFIITESSTKSDRKQYKEMLDYVRSRKQKTAIVVNCVDRLQRSYKDTPALDELRKEGKIEVHFLKEKLILTKDSNGMEIMFWNMSVLMANSYVLSLVDNVKRSQNFNRSIGKTQTSAPIGYINTTDFNGKKTVEIHPIKGPIVKELFEEYATGTHSLTSITNMAKEYGLITERAEKKERPNTVSRTALHYALMNPFYYGYMYYKNNLIRHQYEPLISNFLFDKVQEKLEGKVNSHSKGTYGALPFVFRGLIRCRTCGSIMTEETHTKKSGKEYTYLRCSSLGRNCNQGIVNEKLILQQINDEIFDKSLKIPSNMIPAIQENLQKMLEEEASINANTKRNLTNQMNKLREKEENLLSLLLSKDIDKALFDKEKSKITLEIAALEENANSLVDISDTIKDSLKFVITIAANASVLMQKSTIEQKRKLLALIFDECYINGKKLEYRLKKPFDVLLTTPSKKDWLNLDAENLENLAGMSQEVSAFQATMTI